VLDFTSSLYLGLDHPSRSLAPWGRLTTGVPAAMGEPPEAHQVARGLARLLGVERAVLARSTLHAFLDCFAALGGPGRPVLADAGAYPIARWGAAAAGSRTVAFAHHDPADLDRRLRRLPGRQMPLMLADGLCPGCGGVAPLGPYLELARRHGGLLLVDDTQALGVLGRRDGPTGSAYGAGGGGSPAWSAVGGPGLVAVASLAKGFAAPLAVVGGEGEVIGRIAAGSPTRTHASPPSTADLRAAGRALAANRCGGDAHRRWLAAMVRRLRRRLAGWGVALTGGPFPVQSLPAMPPAAAIRLAADLHRRGVRVVVQQPRCRPGATVTLLVTARHTPIDIDLAAAALAETVAVARPA
jgi:8-amino-7-oxononanoate synthase